MISVIFSSYNGEKTLPLMLEACTKLNTQNIEWEVIAVNNNSTDKTQSILQHYSSKLPLHILFEEKKGKNHALNTALDHVNGDILVFTDDDTIPDYNWLINIQKVTNKHKNYSIFGGKIEPHWMQKPNLWNTEWIKMGIVYAITSELNTAGEIGAGFIWGPNMAIRRSIFDKGFRFNTSIGPNGSDNYAMGSETSFTLMLEREGYKCWFEPSWIVKHIIRESQMSHQWVLSRAIRFGKGEAKKLNILEEKENNTFIFGAPRYLYRKIITQYLVLYKAKLTFRQELSFKTQWEINYLKGLISGIKDL